MTPLRLALIHADDHHHRYLESLLSARFGLALVVIEPDREKVAALRRGGRYRAWARHYYHSYRRALTGENRYRRHYFAYDPGSWPAAGPRRIEVRSVNDEAVVDALSEVAVDVVVSMGCSHLSEATLAAAGPLVINVHSGFPHRCAFFAGGDGRLDRVGSTIHRVAPGLDTGELIEVIRPPLHSDDPPEHLSCRADLLAIHRLAGWLEILERGGELPSYSLAPLGRAPRGRDGESTRDLRYFLRRCTRAAGLARRHPDRPTQQPRQSLTRS